MTAEHCEELGRFLKALRELDPETREIFVLRYVKHLSLAEVATMVGEPLGTVKSRVHRGRQRLEVLLTIYTYVLTAAAAGFAAPWIGRDGMGRAMPDRLRSLSPRNWQHRTTLAIKASAQ